MSSKKYFRYKRYLIIFNKTQSCTLRDQATNHWLQKLCSTFKQDGHTSLKGYMLK
ncbi:hypothetical protein HanIR_Chr01g0036851 [Helianthus annuus]|nr:hypothetical protein HanIR_Chr01g0036851 [Helianthus annuus]